MTANDWQELFIVILALFWVGWSIINAILAKEKGRNVGAMLILSLFCSPMLIYLYLLATPYPKADIEAKIEKAKKEWQELNARWEGEKKAKESSK